MKTDYVMALDQGTTSSRAIIFDRECHIAAMSQSPFEQIFPSPGLVEHNPLQIWSTQSFVMEDAIRKAGINPAQIAAIGITNQRETTIVWDRATSEPIYNAIVWQDRRTAQYCEELKGRGLTETVREKTGLIIDAYFSATKIRWILDNVAGARERARRGELCFGTVDSWLLWKLTGGECHVTDPSNASRTMLFNINTLAWDDELLELFGIPRQMLPEVKESSQLYGRTLSPRFSSGIPVSGIAGDQQAALFGQMCHSPFSAKTTYGTGCFVMMNTGQKPLTSSNNLLTTVGWTVGGRTTYVLEGSVFMGGAVVQWLRDGLHIIDTAAETEALARSVRDTGDVYFVPAMAGLGAPWWDQYARGTIVGLTRGTGRAHIVRAALEAIAFQVDDVLKAMEADAGHSAREMKVDGGAVANDFLMQFQADVSGATVIRPSILESTALGAALLAGLAVGFWENLDDLCMLVRPDRRFTHEVDPQQMETKKNRWHEAVKRSLGWAR